MAAKVAVVGVGPGTQDVATALHNALHDAAVNVVRPLTAAQAIDRHADKSDMPDLLVVVRHPSDDSKVWRMDVCDVATGASLGDETWEQDGAPDVTVLVDRFKAKAAAAAMQIKSPIAVLLPINSGDFTLLDAGHKDPVRNALEQKLHGANVVLMDLRNAWLIGEQRSAAGAGAVTSAEPLIISGQVRHVAQGGQFTLVLTLSYQGKKVTEWASQLMTADDLDTELTQGVGQLVAQVPAAAPNRPGSAVRQNLAEAAKALMGAGDFFNALQVQETGLLHDPGDPALHGNAAIAYCTVLENQRRELVKGMENAGFDETYMRTREFCLNHADEISWGVYHVQVFSIGTTIVKPYSKPESGFCAITGLAPADIVRTSIYNVFKAKHEAKQKDEYPRLVTYLTQGCNAFNQSPQFTEDQQFEYAKRIADVWTFSGDNGFELLGSLPLSDRFDATPRRQKFLDYLQQSPNADAKPTAESIQKTLKKFADGKADGKNVAPAERGPEGRGPVAATARKLWLPNDSYSGFANAGPHADAYFCGGIDHMVLYYLCDDGSGRKLGLTWHDSLPVFDGKYLWYVGREKERPFVAAFDPATGITTVDHALDEVPRDPVTRSRFLPIEPGRVCLVSQLGKDINRTWVALAKVNSSESMTVTVVQTCDKPAPRWNEQPKNALPRDVSFTVENMFMLPGPPNGGDKIRPLIYVFRDITGVLLVDPADGSCSTYTPVFGRFNALGFISRDNLVFLHDKQWDPRTNVLKPIPRIGNGPRVMTPDGTVYNFGGKELFKAKAGGQGKQISWSASPELLTQHATQLEYSNLFGLVYDRYHQLVPLPGHSDVPAPGVTDPQKWYRAFAKSCQDQDVYRTLVSMDAAEGYDDAWGDDMANVIKTYDLDPDTKDFADPLSRADDEVQLADYYMHRGDYASAKPYAEDAAKTGAEWAIQENAFVAEGLGDWESAEKLIRQAADSYGNSFAWYNWCARTGHGDLAAAKAAALAAVDQSGSPAAIAVTHAWSKMFEGDQKGALDDLKLIANRGKNLQAALLLANIAAETKDDAERDKMLDVAAACDVMPRRSGGPIAFMIKELYEGGNIKPDTFKQATGYLNRVDKPLAYFALGRAYLAIGDKTTAVFYLQRAAAMSSHRVSRTLAALQLRALHLPVPKPCQYDDVLKKAN